jgi:UDP-3-O-[3-hydroxymyristoyl] glucosamine N-acyltransferase
MEFTVQQSLSNAMNQNRINLLIFIQQMQNEVQWKRHTSQAKGSSLLSKTSNTKEKEKTAVYMSNPSQTFPLSAHPLHIIGEETIDFELHSF